MFNVVGQKHNIEFSKTEQNNSSKLTILLAIIRLSRGLKNDTYKKKIFSVGAFLHERSMRGFPFDRWIQVSVSDGIMLKNRYVLFLIFFHAVISSALKKTYAFSSA
jgi:hypothetical protein